MLNKLRHSQDFLHRFITLFVVTFVLSVLGFFVLEELGFTDTIMGYPIKSAKNKIYLYLIISSLCYALFASLAINKLNHSRFMFDKMRTLVAILFYSLICSIVIGAFIYFQSRSDPDNYSGMRNNIIRGNRIFDVSILVFAYVLRTSKLFFVLAFGSTGLSLLSAWFFKEAPEPVNIGIEEPESLAE